MTDEPLHKMLSLGLPRHDGYTLGSTVCKTTDVRVRVYRSRAHYRIIIRSEGGDTLGRPSVYKIPHAAYPHDVRVAWLVKFLAHPSSDTPNHFKYMYHQEAAEFAAPLIAADTFFTAR